MAKTRMTNTDRERLRNDLLNHKFVSLRKRHKIAEAELADALWLHWHSPHIAAMDAMPDGAFVQGTRVCVRAYGQYHSLTLLEPRRFFHKFTGHNELGASPQAEAVEELARAGQKIEADATDLRFKLDATLAMFRNFEDVVQHWPEAADIVEGRLSKKREFVVPNLPAVQLADLTAALDLPALS